MVPSRTALRARRRGDRAGDLVS